MTTNPRMMVNNHNRLLFIVKTRDSIVMGVRGNFNYCHHCLSNWYVSLPIHQ